eukprot:scaffold166419_cov36-Tisochrysis_lutea.AAC.1
MQSRLAIACTLPDSDCPTLTVGRGRGPEGGKIGGSACVSMARGSSNERANGMSRSMPPMSVLP